MAGRQPTLAQLRPALQLALEVATAATGPLPGRVRNLVRSRRLPASWPATMRHVLEEDEEFRKLVCARAEEGSLGRLSWLWLSRPEGWAGQVEALVEAARTAREQEQEEEKEARSAAERIAELEGELARARSGARAASAASAELESDLEATRRRVARLEGELRSARAASEAEVSAATSAAASAAAGELRAARERAASLQADNDEQQRLIAALRAELHETRAARNRAEAAERSALQAHQHRVQAEVDGVRRSVGAAVGRAAAAAREMGDAMAEASRLLAGETGTRTGPPAMPPGAPVVPGAPWALGGVAGAGRGDDRSGGPAAGPAGTPPPGTGRRPPAARGERPRRHPLSLPPAVFDDSPEAAAHLVRAPGVHLVVDGYNVTFTSWTGDDLPALRHRLVTALSELAVRVKRPVTVVFDGADEGGRVGAPPVARPWLRIFFSASSVEADEVIVDAVRALPTQVPVVVVTNDRKVRDDVRRLGANVLSVDQLLGVLGRQPDGPGTP